MSRALPVVITVAAFVTVSVLVAQPPAPSALGGAPAAPGPPPAAKAPSSAAAQPRPGRQLSIDAAIKELDLIRPGRGKIAEDFTASLLDGNRFRLVEQRGAVVLVNFWATWCPPCREEMPSMERLWRRHRDRGFVLIAVSLDSDPALVAPFLAKHELTFPVAIDSRLEVANRYGILGLPTSFVLDRAGTVVGLAQGPRTWDNDAAHSLIEGLTR